MVVLGARTVRWVSDVVFSSLENHRCVAIPQPKLTSAASRD